MSALYSFCMASFHFGEARACLAEVGSGEKSVWVRKTRGLREPVFYLVVMWLVLLVVSGCKGSCT